jgi:hypothetical protein
MKAIRDAKKAPYGPNIVRAWFDTVFQHALRGLENERGFLTRRNWTFRFRSSTFEHLGVVLDLVPSAAKVNLLQFESFFPGVAEAMDRHDGHVGRLLRDCRALYKAIIDNKNFRDILASVEVEAPQRLGREFQSYFGAYSSESDFMSIIAEYLINNIEDLPTVYATAELWNHYRPRFAAAITTPALKPLQEETIVSGQLLLESVENLISQLETTRSELSLRFDVPIVEGVSSVR